MGNHQNSIGVYFGPCSNQGSGSFEVHNGWQPCPGPVDVTEAPTSAADSEERAEEGFDENGLALKPSG